MKYVSIDIETTGLDEDKCQIVEFGAIFDDLNNQLPLEKLPRFHAYILPKDGIISGQPYALSLHSEIFKRIANQTEGFVYLEDHELPQKFSMWLLTVEHGLGADKEFVACGKNFAGFDKKWIENIPNWKNWVNCHHRSIDVGNLYCDFLKDERIPGLEECLKRAGLEHHKETYHTALGDAMDVVRLMRAYVERQKDIFTKLDRKDHRFGN